jgi:hypothetical protein
MKTMNPMDIKRALEHEFAAHWLIDELPNLDDETVLNTELPRRATNSARRLRMSVGDGQIEALKQYLDSIQANQQHPFLSVVANTTGMAWMDSPGDWKVFQRLLELIKNSL